MKKLTALFLTLSLAISAFSCSPKNDCSTSTVPGSTVTGQASTDKLVCHMTDSERSRVTCGELTVFKYEQPASPIPSEGTAIEVWSKSDLRDYWSNYRCNFPEDTSMTEEDIRLVLEDIEKLPEDYMENRYGFVDGEPVSPCPMYGYDGGEYTVSITPKNWLSMGDDGDIVYYNDKDEIITEDEYMNSFSDSIEKTFNNYEEMKEYIRSEAEFNCKLSRKTPSETEKYVENAFRLWENVISGSYTTLHYGSHGKYMERLMSNGAYWEIDHDAVMAIKDHVKEYSFYDQQLGMSFIVHVTTPPDFDPDFSYPVYVLTDGVWRFNNCPDMYRAMEEGKAADVILVSIGLDYLRNGMDDNNRKTVFCQKCEKFLDFITDDLMPYLGEEYNIDFSSSTLYGHSLGGTFTHYAAFNSDKYENQPFYHYIIGSPAFWSPGFIPYVDQAEVLNEYGYFDRNSTMDKHIFVCAGADEDPVYEMYYGNNDSTIEGVEHLMQRLTDHNFTNAECKLYPDSEHYQFIPDMLVETLEKYYPAE